MQFINIKEMIFKNNGFETTKIDHMNYSNAIPKEEFNKVVEKIIKDITACEDEEHKPTVMKTPMTESKVVVICYNDKGILTKILIIYITDTQDKLKKEEPVKKEDTPTDTKPVVESNKSETDIMFDIINSDEWKDQFNKQTKAILLAYLVTSKVDEKKLQHMLELGKRFIE